jgi:YbbR domain-containing protein
VDLSRLSNGIHSVDVKVETSGDYQVVDWDPKRVTVRLEPFAQQDVPVQVQLSGKLPDGYLLVSQSITPDHVTVSGEQDLVQSVAQASVSTSLDGVRGDVTEGLTPTLLDDKGQPVQGLQFTPSSVRVSLAVDRQIGVKTVPIRVTTSGQVASGYWLSSLAVAPETVTITGGPTALSQVEFIDLPPLDVNGAKADIDRSTKLTPTADYTFVGDSTVEVKASVQPLRTTEVLPVGISAQGVPAGLEAKLSQATVNVSLGGLAPALAALKPGDVTATVDASNLSAGPHTLPVHVSAPNSVSVDSVQPAQIPVTLAPPSSSSAAPAASAAASAAPAASSTPAASPAASH